MTALVLLSRSPGGRADDPQRPQGTGDDAAEGDRRSEPPRVFLRSGDVIRGSLTLGRIEVDTRYGLLSVPEEEVIHIRFARRIPEPERELIESSVGALGDADFDRREEAMATLRSVGPPARRFLRGALRSTNEEAKSRAQSLLEEIAEASAAAEPPSGIEPLRDTEDDEILTRRFTIRGSVRQDRFAILSPYGELTVMRDDLVGIVVDPSAKISRKIEVPGANTVPDSWLDTKFDVPAGSRVSLRAKGQVYVPNYNLTSGPEGSSRYSGSSFGTFRRLSLVGRIGRNGKPFLVGREAKTKAPREGRLYLGIVPFNRTHKPTGSFQVELQSGEY